MIAPPCRSCSEPTPRLGRADVTVRGKLVGRVLAGNLDQSAARQLARRANEPPGRVGFLVNEHFMTGAGAIAASSRPKFGKASDLDSYRVVAVPLPGRDRSAGLVALKPQSEITAAATRARWEVVLVGLGVIASLLFIAYAVAPAIARTRLSRQQRDQAERVLAHLGDGVIVVDSGGVVRLWNRAAEAITGLRSADVTNRPAEEAIPGWTTIAAFVPVANRPGEGDGTSTEETVPVEL